MAYANQMNKKIKWQRRTSASEEYLYHIILKPASQNIKNQQGINKLIKMLMQPIRTCKQVNLVGLAQKMFVFGFPNWL